MARVADNFTDSQGGLHYRDFFGHIRSIADPEKLKAIKSTLEAANDKFAAQELADALVEVDSSFSKFRDLIKSLPAKEVHAFVNTIVSIITLILAYIVFTSNEEHQEENLELQVQQHELAKAQFEYQKDRDEKTDIKSESSNRELDALKDQLHELEADFERRLKRIESVSPSHKERSKGIKGSERNKPCPCGSGKKYKHCHPRGYYAIWE